MKEIKAFVRPDRAPAVLDVLFRAGIRNITLAHVMAAGACSDASASMNIEFGCQTNRMAKMEIICLDKEENEAIRIIQESACTRQCGDGLIMVSNINRLVNIRTAAESTEAL